MSLLGNTPVHQTDAKIIVVMSSKVYWIFAHFGFAVCRRPLVHIAVGIDRMTKVSAMRSTP